MSKTYTGFCPKCKCDVDLVEDTKRLDNGSYITLACGECPICHREYEETT